MNRQLSLLDDEGYALTVLTLDQYQDYALVTAAYPEKVKLIYPTLGLAGEAGEFANKIKKVLRGDQGGTGELTLTTDQRDALIDELGDILWYIAATATDLDINLSDVAARNVAKLYDRQQRNVLKGDGDTR